VHESFHAHVTGNQAQFGDIRGVKFGDEELFDYLQKIIHTKIVRKLCQPFPLFEREVPGHNQNIHLYKHQSNLKDLQAINIDGLKPNHTTILKAVIKVRVDELHNGIQAELADLIELYEQFVLLVEGVILLLLILVIVEHFLGVPLLVHGNFVVCLEVVVEVHLVDEDDLCGGLVRWKQLEVAIRGECVVLVVLYAGVAYVAYSVRRITAFLSPSQGF